MNKHLGVLTITWNGQWFELVISRRGVIEHVDNIQDSDLNIPEALKQYLKKEGSGVPTNQNGQ